MIGDYNFLPCTPAGVMELIASTGTDVSGKDCVVIGRSNIVGKPQAMLLLHYPPVYGTSCNYEMLEVLHKYNIKWCFYGHIHGSGSDYAINGCRDGINYRLVASDFLQFDPMNITKIVQCDNL